MDKYEAVADEIIDRVLPPLPTQLSFQDVLGGMANILRAHFSEAQAELSEAAPKDPTRCAICGWPMREGHCQPGDCSMRPFPPRYYDAVRARRESAPHKLPDEAPPTREEQLEAEVVNLRSQLEAERARGEKLRRIVSAQDEYINMLLDELNETVPIATNHHWKSSRYELGVRARERIASAKAALFAHPQSAGEERP